ncbi:unnamed protein product [Eruca vesicaria subsp. sativa]|uniref:Uncharacterized protein n=1 Tax=Eruca vesicaria subsp. sativa TaxID=29727 RepID=A0ABC8MA75_ERUVS|nr:unnamed protein product [Eruca vesicaria subsp. sativa]
MAAGSPTRSQERSSWSHQYFCNNNDIGNSKTYEKPASDEESIIRNQKSDLGTFDDTDQLHTWK